jgi:hypothetical protein
MADLYSNTDVRAIFNTLYEEQEDWFLDLNYDSGASQVWTSEESNVVPEGWTISVEEINTETDYDSYGDRSLEDGNIIFKVSDGNAEALYKLPVSYASFEGWSQDLSGIVRVEKREKLITAFEWVDA